MGRRASDLRPGARGRGSAHQPRLHLPLLPFYPPVSSILWERRALALLVAWAHTGCRPGTQTRLQSALWVFTANTRRAQRRVSTGPQPRPAASGCLKGGDPNVGFLLWSQASQIQVTVTSAVPCWPHKEFPSSALASTGEKYEKTWTQTFAQGP